MPRTQDELKYLFNNSLASDADMDEYINAGYDYNALGPNSKKLYDQRKAAMQAAAASTQSETNEAPNVQPTSVQPTSVQPTSAQPAAQPVATPYKMKSIQQAYYDGDIDKNTRDYLLADTIGKFARNMGKDVGNIAAAYSGGTVNNEREDSLWNARNEAMASTGVNVEQNKVAGSTNEQQYRSGEAAITSQELSNRVKELQKTPAENFSKEAKALYAKANDKNLSPEERQQYKMQARLLDLVAAASTQEIGAEEYMATLATNPEVQKLLGEILKGIGKGAGFASNVVETTVGTIQAATDTFKGTDKAVNESKALTPEEKQEYNTTKDKKRKTELRDKGTGTVGGMYLMQ